MSTEQPPAERMRVEGTQDGLPIALIRHFPTDWNGEGRLQGQTDRPLTDAARDWLATLALPAPWDTAAIVSSPLSRALDTALALSNGRRPRLEPRLVEISWGDWEGKTMEDMGRDPERDASPIDDLGWRGRPPGGESAADGWARAQEALARIAARAEPAVIVSHKALMRAILGMSWQWRGPDEGSVDIRRARLYPLRLAADGSPFAPEDPVRLLTRSAAAGATSPDSAPPQTTPETTPEAGA